MNIVNDSVTVTFELISNHDFKPSKKGFYEAAIFQTLALVDLKQVHSIKIMDNPIPESDKYLQHLKVNTDHDNHWDVDKLAELVKNLLFLYERTNEVVKLTFIKKITAVTNEFDFANKEFIKESLYDF